MLMALEPDLYLLPEDKGIKITTTEKRQEGREQVERAEILSSSGKSSGIWRQVLMRLEPPTSQEEEGK